MFLPSNPKAIFHQEGICKSFLEIREGYMTTREKHLTNVHHDKPGFSSAAPVFDPKQFKANKEVMERSGGRLTSSWLAVAAGLSGPGLCPGRGQIVLCSPVLGQGMLLSRCLSPPYKLYKWVVMNLMLGVTLRCTSIPHPGGGGGRGGEETPLIALCYLNRR